ncbi:hypothetical protein BDZ89DRAFT_1057958 [Hymenopellis radicata]|nr:hypothetical protein BDZ89DRAFT_1074646 [Hymenopellis radicata]KAF9048005.1 hypothetical protein BDZ89DRAFT_1057958 [Hymenopellis radicata]
MSPPLPLELIETIINYLLDDEHSLRRAALISRAWFIPSQRALFRRLDLTLDLTSRVACLRTHLRRYPHLQNHIRHVIMVQGDNLVTGLPPSKGHLAALTTLFFLMPKLTFLDISFDRSRPWGRSDQSFFKAFGAFLRGTPSLNAIDIHGLYDEEDFQQMFLYLENTTVKRVSLQLDGYDDSGQDDPEKVTFFTSTLAVVRLPQVEMLRFQLWHRARDMTDGLKIWFSEHQTMFPGLKHLEVAVDDVDDFDIWFRDILQPIPTLRLESFRLGFDGTMTNWLVPRPDMNLFGGLHFDHLKFGIYIPCSVDGADHSEPEAEFYIWLSSNFHLLTPDSVHFTELTFTVTDWFSSGTMWGTLDDALSLEAFGEVKRIHFETWKDRDVITDLAHPDLASKIRSALPRLDSRGVLCFL